MHLTFHQKVQQHASGFPLFVPVASIGTGCPMGDMPSCLFGYGPYYRSSVFRGGSLRLVRQASAGQMVGPLPAPPSDLHVMNRQLLHFFAQITEHWR